MQRIFRINAARHIAALWPFGGLRCLVIGLMFAALVGGCRGTPTGLGIQIARECVRGAGASNRQEALVGKPLAEADTEFGERAVTYTDEPSSDWVVFYRLASLPTMDHFYVVRASATGTIMGVNGWLRMSDGLEDLLKLAWVHHKVIDQPIDEAAKRAKLRRPLLVLHEDAASERYYVYDVSNFTHFHARYLRLTVDAEGFCRRADYFGIAREKDRRGNRTRQVEDFRTSDR